MTLDEAIRHAEEVAEEQEKAAKEWHENQVRKCELIPFAEMDYTHENECKECASEHRQLAEWLKDYKRLKKQELKPGHWYVNEWGNITCTECGCAALYDKVYPGESVFGKAIRVKSTFRTRRAPLPK